jgi:uncharacterized protein (DUF1499 family)
MYFWLGFSCIVALCVFRFWPVTSANITTDIFTADHGRKPNYYLSNENEGQFNVSANALENAFIAQLSNTPRLKETFVNRSDVFLATYVERSLVVGFPDVMSVKIETRSPSSAAITLFSQSKFGYSDFGVNRKRVKNLLAGLRQQLGT